MLKFKKLDDAAQIPQYETDGAAGMDIRCVEGAVIPPNSRASVGTGLAVEIPKGYELQCRPRSGLALKHGLTVLNTPGTIDSDYRGEIRVILYNTSTDNVLVSPGDRVAQLVLAHAPRLEIVEVDELSDTSRGSDGFGSTGVK